MDFINESQRQAVFDRVLRTIHQRFVSPHGHYPNTHQLKDEHAKEALHAGSTEEFEAAINQMLEKLGASHTGFFHESKPRAAGRIAIAATFMRALTEDGDRWVFQDVHPGGIAHRVGIRPGHILLTVDGKEIVPPEPATFQLGRRYCIAVRRGDNSTSTLDLEIPASKEKKRPLIVPDQVVNATRLSTDVAYIRISMFPGILGIDVARDISRAVAELDCPMVIFDLRGNTGGGLGCLRVMSLLSPDKRGAGYSVGRKEIERGFEKERLPRFDHIPSSRWGVLPLIAKFGMASRSVSLFSEGLGNRKHHGRVAMLVNEHSASAAEMAIAFAAENRLAQVVGTRTAGRLVGANSFKVGFKYRLALPVSDFRTWAGRSIESQGIEPTHKTSPTLDNLRSGQDIQLVEALTGLGIDPSRGQLTPIN